MIFAEKIEELRTFVRKTNGDKSEMANKEILLDFIDIWEKDTRVQMGLPETPGHTIGISFNEDIQLQMMPQWAEVQTGFYESSVGLRIEVQRQSQEDGSVIFTTICGEETSNIEAMSFNIFTKLFKRITPKS